MYSRAVKFFWVLCIAYSSCVAADSSLSGVIQSVRVDRAEGGTFIQLQNSPLFEASAKCTSSWVFIPKTESFEKEFLTIAISSKAIVLPVRIVTDGCVKSKKDIFPRLESIEAGAQWSLVIR
jgi:hypothetical protein